MRKNFLIFISLFSLNINARATLQKKFQVCTVDVGVNAILWDGVKMT